MSNDHSNTKFIDLSSLNIANCTGCFGCWTKTPGKCVIRDDATKSISVHCQEDNCLIYRSVKYYMVVMILCRRQCLNVQLIKQHLLEY